MSYAPFPDRFPRLREDGLLLRELGEQDLPAWFERLSDEEAAELAGDPVATSMQVLDDGLAHHRKAFREQAGLRWAIVPDDPGTSIGSIGFVGLDPKDHSAELGAAIGRAHWGAGFGTRAARLVIGYGFSQLELSVIEAVALPENGRTLHVLAKLGFTERRGPCPSERCLGGRADSLLYSLARCARTLRWNFAAFARP